MSFYSSGTEITVTTTSSSGIDASIALRADGSYIISRIVNTQTVETAVFNNDGSLQQVVSLGLVQNADRAYANTDSVALADGSLVVAYSTSYAGTATPNTAVLSATNEYLYNFGTSNLTQSWQFSPEVVALSGTQFVYAYENFETIGAGFAGTSRTFPHIFQFGFSESGGTGLDNDFDMTALSNGDLAAVWTEPGTGAMNAFISVISGTDGSRVLDTFDLYYAINDSYLARDVAITAISDGKFIVAWMASAFGQDNLLIQIYDELGNNVNGNDFAGYIVEQIQPVLARSDLDLTTLADGRVLMTWTEAGADGAGNAVMARVLNEDGTFAGTAFRLNTTTDGNQQDVNVVATADGGFMAVWEDNSSGAFQVKMQQFDLNTAPTSIALDTASVDEFANTHTTVGTLSATDEAAGSLSYTLLDDAGGRFVVDGNELKVANGVALDFEQAQSHDITVRATDEHGLTVDATLTISVNDVNPETVVGTSAGETIVGGQENDRISGMGGNDTLAGSGGNDTLDGGADDDEMAGGTGNDRYFVDSLGDIVREAAGSSNGTQDTVVSEVAFRLDTTTTAQGIEHIFLSGSANVCAVGSSVFNVLGGNDGDNYLSGLGGNDTIDGGAGNDRVYGGAGKDTLLGGLGDDKFIFAYAADSRGTAGTRDVIRDFSQALGNDDTIDLSLIDANLGVAGNQAFDFVGTDTFSGAAGELRYYQDAANNRTIIEGNTFAEATGAIAEFSVELTGLHNLTAGTLAGFDIWL